MKTDPVPHSLAPPVSGVPPVVLPGAPIPVESRVAFRESSDVETSSDRYAHRFRGSVGHSFLDRQERGVLALLADLPRGSTVLDVGGGHGQLVAGLRACGFRVTVAGSEAGCAARLRGWLERGEIAFVAADLLALPLPDHAYDAVVSIRLLGHAREWPQLLDELTRVARQAVVVDFASTRSLNALARRLFAWKIAIEGDTRPFAVLDPREVAERLARAGFADTRVDPQYLLPMAFYRFCRSRRLLEAVESVAAVLGVTRAFGSPVLLKAGRTSACP